MMDFDFSMILKVIKSFPNSLILLILSNVLLILGFIIGKIALYKAENAVKFYSLFSVFICSILAIYFVSILWFSLSNLYLGNAIYAAIFPIFLFLPFIIGHFASYEKVHFYTNIQILTLIISLLLALSFI